jgi:hypothetical protein
MDAAAVFLFLYSKQNNRIFSSLPDDLTKNEDLFPRRQLSLLFPFLLPNHSKEKHIHRVDPSLKMFFFL